MNDRKTFILDRILPAALTLVHILCMAYAAAQLAVLLFIPEGEPWFFLFFCALSGLMHTIGVCINQPRMSAAAFCAVDLLAAFLLPNPQAWAQIAASAAVYSLLYLLENRSRPRQLLVVLAAAGLVFCFFSGRDIPLPLAAAILLLVLTELASSPLHPDHERGLRLIPFLLLLECAVFLLPAGEKPFDWSFVVRIGQNAAEMTRSIVVDLQYYLSSDSMDGSWRSGYGEPALFGGRFSDDNRQEAALSSRSTRGSVYLSGEEYAAFDGSRWEHGQPETSALTDWYLMFLNALYQSGTTREEAECFAQVCSTQITYRYLRTKDILHPLNLLRMDDTVLREMTGDGGFSLRRSRSNGFTYKITFLELDYANPYLMEILRNAGSFSQNPWPSYEQISAYSRDLLGLSLSTLTAQTDYEARIAAIRQADLRQWLDTDGISQRAASLAGQVTDGCTDTFDRCLAIESYLRQYPYTKDVDYSGYTNYADAFLFEKQTGWCIHYASAMVMMLRSLNIPARLVEGYCCDYETADKDGYAVLGRHAHTWPEAYIEGFGWVRFEPTAAIPSAADTGWNLRVREESPELPAVGETNDGQPELPAPALPIPPATEEAAPAEGHSRLAAYALFLAAIPAVYLFLLLVLQPLLRHRRFRRMDDAGKFTAQLRDCLWLIRALYPGRWDNRPLLDYAEAVESPAVRKEMETVCLAAYRLRYTAQLPDDTALQSVRAVRSSLYSQYIGSGRRGRTMRKLSARLHLAD